MQPNVHNLGLLMALAVTGSLSATPLIPEKPRVLGPRKDRTLQKMARKVKRRNRRKD